MNSTILIIGAVALDRPIWLDGPVHPGARVRGRSLDAALEGRLGGGAANAGCALIAAGHKVVVGALFAEDADGERTRALALAAGLDLFASRTRPGPSGRTLLLIEPTGERTIIGLDGAPGARLSPVAGPADCPRLAPDALFIRSAFDGAAAWAQAVKGPVVLHWPSPGYAGPADIVVASADDLSDDIAAAPFAPAAAVLGPRLRWVVVTHGAHGAVAYGPHDAVRVSAPSAQVRDATGAGDVFAAGLIDALVAQGGVAQADIERALAHACAWGAAAVELEGSALPGGGFAPFAQR